MLRMCSASLGPAGIWTTTSRSRVLDGPQLVEMESDWSSHRSGTRSCAVRDRSQAGRSVGHRGAGSRRCEQAEPGPGSRLPVEHPPPVLGVGEHHRQEAPAVGGPVGGSCRRWTEVLDAGIGRPCSSPAYQPTDPASSATSSRRSPSVRRVPRRGGRPTSGGSEVGALATEERAQLRLVDSEHHLIGAVAWHH